ncbi:MAG TPA: hypothetical protein VK841_20525 [Polyangiaceae bacterium]|jgi:hypothetical protein|nr:hypothetical protein [Polyangiaceae bacterium]
MPAIVPIRAASRTVRTVCARAACAAIAIAAAGCSSNPASHIGEEESGSPIGRADAASEAAAPRDASGVAPDVGTADANDPGTADANDASADRDARDGASDADGGPGPGPYTVGGTLTFVAGTGLVLRNAPPDAGPDAGETLAIASGMASFAFPTRWPTGASYDVSVDQQPSMPNQTCVVNEGAGEVNGGPVTSIAVVCTTETYTLGGTVTGLGGATGLVLLGPNHDSLAISADGPFSFPSVLADGSSYDVTVAQQPFGVTCQIANGAGTIQEMDTQIVVTCS